MSELLYALRTAPKENKISPAELHTSRKFTTVKDIITTKPVQNNYNVSDNDNNFELTMSDFPADQDSEILVTGKNQRIKTGNGIQEKEGPNHCRNPTYSNNERTRQVTANAIQQT